MPRTLTNAALQNNTSQFAGSQPANRKPPGLPVAVGRQTSPGGRLLPATEATEVAQISPKTSRRQFR